jgi:hypothetical protein
MGRKRKVSVFVMAACGILLGITGSASADDTGLNMKNIDFTGYGAYQDNDIVKGALGTWGLSHYWSHEVLLSVGFDARLSSNFSLCAAVEGEMWNPYPNAEAGPSAEAVEQQYSFWIREAEGTYWLGEKGNPWFSVTAGYFPYKYDPEVRNLGEYLFRSYTYPGLIFNNFDFPAARVLGAKASLQGAIAPDIVVKNDLLLTEEDATWPFGDFSVTDVADINFWKVIDFGAGVDFANYISVNSGITTPQASYNELLVDSAGVGVPAAPTITSYTDNTGHIHYDTTYSYYTFKAIKPMGRITLDPKPLLGDFGSLLSPEDLKIYGEICVIGTQNQSYWYESVTQRTPRMAGIYLPTFKLLDMLNFECEYYPFPYSTSNSLLINPQPDNNQNNVVVPVPAWSSSNGVYGANPGYPINDAAWRWSIYAKETILPGVALTVQCARDRERLNVCSGYQNNPEVLVLPGEWAWSAKISANL